MKIYLAGASEEAERCAAAMQQLQELGHAITEDWTVSVLANGADDDCTVATLREAAHRNVAGVKAADLLIVLVPKERGSIGWSFEMGCALANLVDVWWVGRKQSCFWTLADRVFTSFDEALEALREAEAELCRSVLNGSAL